MSNTSDIKYIVYKKQVYVIKIGPLYLWQTAASIKSECVRKALEHFNINDECFLKYKGAEVVRLFIKEIRVQENNSNKSV